MRQYQCYPYTTKDKHQYSHILGIHIIYGDALHQIDIDAIGPIHTMNEFIYLT